MKNIVCILGMHRSGTSMLAHLIREMGVYFGEWEDLYEETEFNQDGHFELKEVVDIHDDILRYYSRSWLNVSPFMLDTKDSFIEECKDKLKKYILEKFRNVEYMGLKDPRMCFFLPMWNEIFLELGIQVKYITIYRNPIEVGYSLKRRDGLPVMYGEKLWVQYNNELLENINNKKIFLVTYDGILHDEIWVERIYEFIFGSPRVRGAVPSVVKKEYKHEMANKEDCKKEDKLVELYTELIKYTRGEIDKREIERICMLWRANYSSCLKALQNRKQNNYDLALFGNVNILFEDKIIIYGAGKRGKIVFEQLYKIGIMPEAFCDIVADKLGRKQCDIPILDLNELERMSENRSLLVIIAIENVDIADNAREVLNMFPAIKVVSYFTVSKAIDFYLQSKSGMENTLLCLQKWYSEQSERISMLKDAIEAEVVIYQNGKVGSSTILHSLRNAQIDAVQLHRVKFDNDIVQRVLCGENRYPKLIKQSSFSYYNNFLEDFITAFRNREKIKIISLVREPISTDISTVFQWLGTGMLDRYIVDQNRDVIDVMLELVLKLKNRMFEWFESEFEEVLGIRIYDYPFDKKKGYIHIVKNNMDILVIQAEKIEKMQNVIGKFVNSREFRIQNCNIASRKEYRQLYAEFMNRIKLPEEYVKFYYKNNDAMNFFYSKDDQDKFLNKWRDKTEEAVDNEL